MKQQGDTIELEKITVVPGGTKKRRRIGGTENRKQELIEAGRTKEKAPKKLSSTWGKKYARHSIKKRARESEEGKTKGERDKFLELTS